jgi:hypothetical protein
VRSGGTTNNPLHVSIYDPLRELLAESTESSLALSFEEIERLIGQPLPKSAHEYDAWWSNEDPDKTTHVQQGVDHGRLGCGSE